MASVISFLKAIKGSVALKHALKNRPNPRIVVGASGVFQDDWIPTDVHTLNLLKPERWKFFLKENSIESILAEHVWEHLAVDEGTIAAKTCYRYIKNGGYARIAVPDGYHNKKEYINYVKPGGTGDGANDHKVLYTYKTLSKVFTDAGFSIKLLEYFDEQGEFHFTGWDPKKGMVHRSKRFDERNTNNELNYTSLIIDAIK
ncbi:MAG: hypothetical protein ABIN89_31380 [Chitinophagaceae bacterium]